ncbi:MAG: endonuclease MutS2, partial [Chloroflexota bacterium]|nr:endonuclease MutS2 [Chloroflexota bacterium]
MQPSVLRRLDFPEVLRRLSTHCHYSVAMERARELHPADTLATVRVLMEITDEAVDLVSNFPDVTVGGARDIRDAVEKAGKGGRLQPSELLQIGDTLRAARELRRFFQRLPDAEHRFPHLTDISDHLGAFPALEADIGRTVGPRGDVLDTASEELGRIRRAVRVAYSRLMDRLNNLISGGRYGGALQENI